MAENSDDSLQSYELSIWSTFERDDSPFAVWCSRSCSVARSCPVRREDSSRVADSLLPREDPAKIAEVDKLLAKYHGQEEQLFRNLAKKYNLNPSVFGLSAAPAGAFGAPSPGIASSPGGFGQPSALGGTPTFGSPPPSFAGAAGGGFGGAATTPGQGFGSASGASPFGSQGFGALAHSPAPAGFGSYGSPPATPFGGSNASPFGAPRR